MGYRVEVDDCTRDLDVRTDLQQPVLALIGLAKPPMPHASMPQAGMKGAMAGDMKQSMTAGMEQMQQMTMSGNTDKDFAMMMKIHHEGALDMAELQLANGKSPELKAMAKRTIAAQKMDIAKVFPHPNWSPVCTFWAMGHLYLFGVDLFKWKCSMENSDCTRRHSF